MPFKELPFALSATDRDLLGERWLALAKAELSDAAALAGKLAAQTTGSDALGQWAEALRNAAEAGEARAYRRLLALADPAGWERPVLIVDDEPTNLRMLTRWMVGAGYKAHAAANGEQALARIRKTRPCVVLLDVNMPVMDGKEALVKLRAEAELQHLPVFFISGYAENALNLPRDEYDYLAIKPLEEAAVLSAISSYFTAAE